DRCAEASRAAWRAEVAVPVKRRVSKRRGDPEALADAWCDVLAVGFDHFGDLEAQGVPVNHAGIPDLEAARAAWAVHAVRVLSAPRDPLLGPTWAERLFGRPGGA